MNHLYKSISHNGFGVKCTASQEFEEHRSSRFNFRRRNNSKADSLHGVEALEYFFVDFPVFTAMEF